MKKFYTLILLAFSVVAFSQTNRKELKQKADACYEKNDYLCAETAYKKLLEEEYNATLKSQYLNKLGTSQRRLGQTAAAFSTYDTALKSNPQNIQSYINLSSLHSQKGDKEKALQYVKLGLMLDDQNADLYLTRAKVYEDQKKNDLAEKDYQTIIGYQPSNMIARSNYAILKMNSGKQEEAIKDYTQMITEKPESLLYNNRAEVHRNMKNYKDALADVQKAIAVDGKFPLSYVTKAKILFDTNKTADACASLEKATALGYEKVLIYSLVKKCEK